MHAPPVRALQSPPLMCLQVPGPRHRRAPRLTGTLDSKLNSLEGHLQQLPAAGQRRRRTHDPAVAASAPELGAVARQADEAAGEDDAAWRPITASTSHRLPVDLVQRGSIWDFPFLLLVIEGANACIMLSTTEHEGAPTHNVEGCCSLHVQLDGCCPSRAQVGQSGLTSSRELQASRASS